MSRNKDNLFRQSRAWKQGVIHSVAMAGRNEYFKPAVVPW